MNKWLSLVGVLLGVSVVFWPGASNRCHAMEMGDPAAEEKNEKIEAALRSPTTLEFVETPLKDIVEYLRDLHKIDVQLDLKSLKEVGISSNTPATRNLKGVTLQSALKLMLGELDLLYTVNKGVLLITTPDTAARQMVTRRHAIEDVLRPNVSPEGAKARGDAIIRFVSAAYAPQAWQPRGGKGTLSLDPPEAPKFLIVEQSADIQEQIVALLDRLRCFTRGTEVPASVPRASRVWNSPASQKIRAALASPTTLEFMETPLSDVVQYLRDLHKIEIQLDTKSVHDVGVSPDTPVTANLKGVPLGTALRVLLHDRRLTYLIDNEVLLITAQERADQIPTVEVYVVADLVGQDAAHATKMAADDLLRVIRRSVEPASWREANGHGVIVAMDTGVLDVLLVRQSYSAHEQLLELLDRLSMLAKLTSDRPPSVSGEPLGYTDAKRRVVRALSTPVSLDVEGDSFCDAIESLRDAAGVNILCDKVAMDDKKITRHTTVKGKWEKQPLEKVLEQLLARWRLVYVVEDGLLWITAAERAQRSFRIEVYALGTGATEVSEADLNELAQKILDSVSPQTWHKAGGEGTITPVLVGSQRALVIRQSPAVHEQISEWLATHAPR